MGGVGGERAVKIKKNAINSHWGGTTTTPQCVMSDEGMKKKNERFKSESMDYCFVS